MKLDSQAQRIRNAGVTLLCVVLGGCISRESIGVDLSNPSSAVNATLVSFHGDFTVSGATLEPAAPGSAVLDGLTYWTTPGDSISVTWNDFSIGLRCPKSGADPSSQPLFGYNLCDPTHGCFNGAQVQACRVQVPDSVGPQTCAHDHAIDLAPFGAINAGINDEIHFIGDGSALDVWLIQNACMNGVCGPSGTPATTSWLWATSCAPTAVSYTPVVDNTMGGDVALQLWATRRVDFAQSPPPQSDDQPGPALNVSAVVAGMPRRDANRVRFVEKCGPGMAACGNPGDPTESQWFADAGLPVAEAFNARLRTREVRVFGTRVDADPMNPQTVAFCSAYQTSDRSGTESQSNCDASAGAQTMDCRAPARGDFSPDDPWKITFSDKPQSNNAPSKCPNNSNRTELWVEFNLEVKP